LLQNGIYNPIVTVNDGHISKMEFSPNGQYIAYVVMDWTGNSTLYKAGSDGSSPTLIYAAPSGINWLWITWAGNQYILCSAFEPSSTYPVTKVDINNPGWSQAIEEAGYLAAAPATGTSFAYTIKEGLQPHPDNVYIKDSLLQQGGPGNGDTLVSTNLTGDMRVYIKKWAGSSLYYIVDDWNNAEPNSYGKSRIDRNGSNVVSSDLMPGNFSVTQDNQYIAFEEFISESSSHKITITSSTGNVETTYNALSNDIFSLPVWSFDSNYILWIKSSMSGSAVMIDEAPNGTTT